MNPQSVFASPRQGQRTRPLELLCPVHRSSIAMSGIACTGNYFVTAAGV